MSPSKKKPTKYYIDFENVHGAGLKGIDELDKNDEVLVFFSQAAETFHIEQAIDILNSKARIEFVEIDGGTRNSLDFQLVAALFGTMDDEHEYAIVSGDGGFDAAIKMGARLELPPVRRITDLTGSTEQPPAKKSSRTRRRQTTLKEPAPQQGSDNAESQPDHQVVQDQSGEAEQPDKKAKTSKPAKQPKEAKKPGKTQNSKEAAHQDKEGELAKSDQKAKEADSSADADSATRSSGYSKEADPDPATASAQPGRHSKEADSDSAASPARSGRYSKRKEIKALLAENGAALNQQQLSTVMKALNGVKNKQGFYRNIIQIEKQERGLELYHKVRDHYEAMVEILHS